MSKSAFAVSVTAATYERLREHSRRSRVPIRRLIGDLADDLAALTPERLVDLVALARAGQDLVRRQAAVRRWDPGAGRLSDAAVVEIRAARGARVSLATLARQHGVSRTTISRIARGVSRPGAGGTVQPKGVYASRQPRHARPSSDEILQTTDSMHLHEGI